MSGRGQSETRAGRPRTVTSLRPSGTGVAALGGPGIVAALATGNWLFLALALAAAVALVVDHQLARRRASRVSVRAAGPDLVTAGRHVMLRIDVTGVGVSACVLGVERASPPRLPVQPPASGDVLTFVGRRGVHLSHRINVATTGPLALVGVTSARHVPFEEPLFVAPAALPVGLDDTPAPDGSPQWAAGEDLYGVRSFADGDSIHDVHWPTVARHGELLVRDRRRSGVGSRIGVLIDTSTRVDEPTVDPETGEVQPAPPPLDGEALEMMLGRARTILERLLAEGIQIGLSTVEREQRSVAGVETCRIVSASVHGRRDVARRLAAVVAGPVDRTPESADLVIRPDGATWRMPA
ncbi:MAG: DUF58 domain-containing protein [Actinomycetota bacterium]